ncbi:MAG: acyltransferase family protein [Spirochaetota bacterium]
MTEKTTVTRHRHDLDWLRVLVILVVFIFHAGRFFDMGDWHVKNPTRYLGVQIWTTFLVNWMMPLIFVISGASTFYALSTRNTGKFIKDRVLRLVVPLIVGMFSHIAVQVYLERVTHGQFSGSFLEWLPEYFNGFYVLGGNFAWMGLHLWYLEVLFLFSLILLPLFRCFLSDAGKRLLNTIGNGLAAPGVIYILALPIMLLLAVLDPRSLLGNRGFGGWSSLIYLLFCVYGFIIIAHDGVQQRIQQGRRVSFTIGAAMVAILILVWAPQGDAPFGTPRFALIALLFGLSSWCWILAILGFCMKHLTLSTPWLPAANEAVLPFYVMHQSVLIAVGYFIVQTPLPDPIKFVVIAASSFAIIIGLYQIVRQFNVLRFLFGMKPLRRVEAGRDLP